MFFIIRKEDGNITIQVEHETDDKRKEIVAMLCKEGYPPVGIDDFLHAPCKDMVMVVKGHDCNLKLHTWDQEA